MTGLNINWPETEEVPLDWQFKKKIANGTLRSFYPEYKKAVEVDFNALYGRGLEKGYIFDYDLQATKPKMSPFDIENSTVRIFE